MAPLKRIGNALRKRIQERAASVARNPAQAIETARSAQRKAERNRSALGDAFEELQALVRLVRAWARREYGRVPWKSIVLAVFGLLYFLIPTDAIPDFVAVLGFTDDIAVIGWVVSSIRGDLREFRAWESGGKEKRRPPSSETAASPESDSG